MIINNLNSDKIVENLLENRSLDISRRDNFKNFLYQKIVFSKENNKDSNVFISLFTRSRYLTMGIFSFLILVLGGLIGIPLLNNSNPSVDSQFLGHIQLDTTQSQIDQNLNKLSDQVQNITLDNDQPLVTESDVQL